MVSAITCPSPPRRSRGFEILSDFLSLLVLFTFPDGSLVPSWASRVLATWLLCLFANQLDLLPGEATEDLFDLVFLGSGLLAMIFRYRTTYADNASRSNGWCLEPRVSRVGLDGLYRASVSGKPALVRGEWWGRVHLPHRVQRRTQAQPFDVHHDV